MSHQVNVSVLPVHNQEYSAVMSVQVLHNLQAQHAQPAGKAEATSWNVLSYGLHITYSVHAPGTILQSRAEWEETGYGAHDK